MSHEERSGPPETETRAKEPARAESQADGPLTYLDQDNRTRFDRMSEAGQKVAAQAYEGLYKVPGVSRMVGKLEIAYNQLWLDKHEEQAVKLKNKVDGFSVRTGGLDESKKEIGAAIENLRQQKIPGVESLQLKLKEIDAQKIELLNKKDKIQSRFESHDNEAKLYASKRDQIADKLIDRYKEKLSPLEKELERMQTGRDQLDLLSEVAAVKHKASEARLAGLDKQKMQIEDALRRTGMSERQIKKFEGVKQLDQLLSQGREAIRVEKENFAKRRLEINRKIANQDKKANVYRDKKSEFARVKEGKPLKIDMPRRNREEVSAGTRPADFDVRHGGGGQPPESRKEEETTEGLETSTYISDWNSHLQEKFGKSAAQELVNQQDFLSATGLPANYRMDFGDFRSILERYLKLKKIPTDERAKKLAGFIRKK